MSIEARGRVAIFTLQSPALVISRCVYLELTLQPNQSVDLTKDWTALGYHFKHSFSRAFRQSFPLICFVHVILEKK